MRQHTHTGAYAVITNNDEIVLIRKSRGAYTGRLDLPGGKIEHGETPNEAVIREINEETGLCVKNVEVIEALSKRVVWLDSDGEEDLNHIGIIYKVNDNIIDNLKQDSDGLDSLGANWYKYKALKEEELSPFAYWEIERLKNNDN